MSLSLTQRKYRHSATNLLRSLNASSFGADEKGVDAENIFMADHTTMNKEMCKGTKTCMGTLHVKLQGVMPHRFILKSIYLVMAWRRTGDKPLPETIETVSAEGRSARLRHWVFTPSGGGDMEIQRDMLFYHLVTSSVCLRHR